MRTINRSEILAATLQKGKVNKMINSIKLIRELLIIFATIALLLFVFSTIEYFDGRMEKMEKSIINLENTIETNGLKLAR